MVSLWHQTFGRSEPSIISKSPIKSRLASITHLLQITIHKEIKPTHHRSSQYNANHDSIKEMHIRSIKERHLAQSRPEGNKDRLPNTMQTRINQEKKSQSRIQHARLGKFTMLLLLADPDLPGRAAHPLHPPLWVRVRYDGVGATDGEHLDQLLIARIKLLCHLLGKPMARRWRGRPTSTSAGCSSLSTLPCTCGCRHCMSFLSEVGSSCTSIVHARSWIDQVQSHRSHFYLLSRAHVHLPTSHLRSPPPLVMR